MRVVTLPGVSKEPLVGVDHESCHHFVFEDRLSGSSGSSEITVTDKGKLANGLSILFIFSKNQVLVLLIFAIVSFIPFFFFFLVK